MELKDLEKALKGSSDKLKPAHFLEENASGHWWVELDGAEKTNSKWRAYMSEALKTAKKFEIHCWNEERDCIELALSYGKLKDTDWPYGVIIAGEVTPEFTEFLLGLPKPADTELYHKMTPFFTIALDNNFWSEHYGTELNGQL